MLRSERYGKSKITVGEVVKGMGSSKKRFLHFPPLSNEWNFQKLIIACILKLKLSFRTTPLQ